MRKLLAKWIYPEAFIQLDELRAVNTKLLCKLFGEERFLKE